MSEESPRRTLWKGHEVETWLEETRALIKRRILAWENRHSDVPSIPRPRVYSDSGVNRVRPRLKTSRSDPPLPTSPSDKSSTQTKIRRLVPAMGHYLQISEPKQIRIRHPNLRNRARHTATESLENLEDITPVESTKSIDGPASSVAAEEENTVPSLIFTDYPEGPDPSLSSPEDPISILTPKDSVASPVVEIYRDPMGPASPGLFDSTRVRTLSETHGTAAVDAKTPVSPEQRPLSCPPVFFAAPLALEEALMKGMDVSSDPEHPESIAKMEEEAVSYLELEQFERATNILLEVLKLRCRIQGESHLFTIQTMSNLGIGYEGQGKLDQAIEVLLVTLKQLKHSHSATNLRFQRSIKERLEELTKRHEEAKRMMNRAIATRVRFDEDLPLHIDVNTTPEAIMAHLTNRRCPNLTELLDTLECSKVPVNRGGFGDIWQGKLTDGRSIAMKRIYQGERKLNKRLAQELYAWSKANHQNVLELLGLAYYKDYLVMVSPWMRYGSVHEYLEKHPESNRLHLRTVSSTCIGSEWQAIILSPARRRYLPYGTPQVHGDLKASEKQNIFVSDEGVLKVGDFGLAVMLGERSVAFQPSTTVGPLGTIRWMAPELFDESGRYNISMKSDIYSLGMTIYVGNIPLLIKISRLRDYWNRKSYLAVYRSGNSTPQ
ncbi:kinesin light chain [Rhizoctonia solani]|uniref:Kinesin light chain n=1 Tax=Rhizoctonia solani TaxID=456999 RepID=A0A8H8SYB6_9AGAM|nr:kinesin light chain [Rhizoctonia solani]QRW21178.1 kinesin light chain [Rhizoctonia solani]